MATQHAKFTPETHELRNGWQLCHAPYVEPGKWGMKGIVENLQGHLFAATWDSDGSYNPGEPEDDLDIVPKPKPTVGYLFPVGSIFSIVKDDLGDCCRDIGKVAPTDQCGPILRIEYDDKNGPSISVVEEE